MLMEDAGLWAVSTHPQFPFQVLRTTHQQENRQVIRKGTPCFRTENESCSHLEHRSTFLNFSIFICKKSLCSCGHD